MLMLWESPLPAEWERVTVDVLLGIGVVVLWRALSEKGKLLTEAMQQLSSQAGVLEDVAEAMDRLRTEVLAKLDHLCEYAAGHPRGK